MCGRFTLKATDEAIQNHFNLEQAPKVEPNYNIPPSTKILCLGGFPLQAKQFRWGLIPSWAKDEKISYKLSNARSETAAQKPSFRAAFKKRRCLIPADGFYEWKRKEDKSKQPFYFKIKDQELFAFAGLWEQWTSPEGQQIRSCTILTKAAHAEIESIHHRMPVILNPNHYQEWCNPELEDKEKVSRIISADIGGKLIYYPVSSRVNSPKNNSADLLEKIEES